MPALGIGSLLFGLVQALISGYVYSEAKKHSMVYPLLSAIITFILGVLVAVLLGGVIELLAVELLLILFYLVVQSVLKGRVSSA